MAAKAPVPVKAFPCIDRFRGHGPLLQFAPHPPIVVRAAVPVGAAAGDYPFRAATVSA
jgi:hypothetical protein